MSVELSSQPVDAGAVVNDQIVSQQSDDAALEAIWNKNERDNGAEREGGRFVSPNSEKRAEAQAVQAKPNPLEGGKGEGQGDGSSTPDVAAVPLPANWRGKEDVWEKIPADLKSAVAGIEGELQRTLSDQGRQLAAFKPVGEVIDKYGRYFAPDSGYKMPDGKVVTPAQGIEFLFAIQDDLERKTVPTIMDIIDRYGVRDQVAAAFGQAPQGDNALRQEIAGLKQQITQLLNPATIDGRIDQRFQAEAAAKAAADEVGRLSKDKPLYSEIPESTMVAMINLAWESLGDTASKDAVFNRAYDMAVNADPDLRAKAAAAKAAAPNDAAKVEAAKRAVSANLTSTSSGKGRALTEDEELAAAWDRSQKG